MESDLRNGVLTTFGCESLTTHLLVFSFFFGVGALLIGIYVVLLPLKNGLKLKWVFWNSDVRIISLLTLIFPIFLSFMPILEFMGAFDIGSEIYLPPFDREIVPSVAFYSVFNLIYITIIFLIHRSYVLCSYKS
jgi:hypothetical protein